MLERIQNVFVHVTGITNFKITPRTRLDNKELGLSSLTKIQLYCEIEEEFGIEIPNVAIKKMKTIKDVLIFLEKNIPSN